MPSIKGTASIPSNVAQTKLLRSTKFPSSFATPVDLTKVNATVMAQWIEKKIESILGFEDEIVSSMAINLFFPKLNQDFSGAGAGAGGSSTTAGASPTTSSSSSVQQKYAPVDPRKSQLDLVGFLGEEDAAKFSCELWEMLIDAQDQPRGIPKKLIEEKKRELAASSAVGVGAAGAAKAALDTKSDYSARINNNHNHRHHGTMNDSYKKENGIKGSSQMQPELGPGRTTITASRQTAVRGRSEGFGPPPPLLSRSNDDSRERQYVDHGRDRFRGEYSSFNTDYHSYSGRTSSRRITGSNSRDHEQGRERSPMGGHPPPPGGGAGYRRYDEDYPSGYSSADSYGRTRRRRKGRSSSGRRFDEHPSTYSRNHDGRRRSDRDDYEDYERRRTSSRRSRRSRRSGKSGSPSRSVSRSRSFSRTNQSPSTSSSRSCSRSKKEEGYQGGDSGRYSRKRSRSKSKSPSYKRYSSDGRSSRR